MWKGEGYFMKMNKRMRKAWKQMIATVCATSLVVGGMAVGASPLQVNAESVNYIVDGDFGDDGGDFWDDGVWKVTDDSWNYLWSDGGVDYNDYAGNGTAYGLGVSFKTDGTAGIYQVVETLPAGTYTLSGSVKDNSDLGGNIKVYHGSEPVVSDDLIENGLTDSFTDFAYQFTLEEDTTEYTIGFQIESYAGAWVCMDSVSLTCTETTQEGDGSQDNSQEDGSDDSQSTEQPSGVVYLADMESGVPSDWNVNWSVASETANIQSVAGSNVWNIWSASAQVLTLTKTMELQPGNYVASFDTAGGNGTVTGNIAISNGTSTQTANMVFTTVWDEYTTVTTKHITLTEATDVTVTITANLDANGYYTMDNIKVTAFTDAELAAIRNAKIETLNTLITVCEGLAEEDYSVDSYAALTAKLSEAKNLCASAKAENSTVTEEEIVAMTASLQAVKDALVEASLAEGDIFVKRLSLADDFIKGVDISSYVSQKESGVVYRDFDGNALDDAGFFNLLKDSGVNWVRIRVWNNPYDANGNGYGGGNNDVAKAKTMGKLATDAGLKVLIDFHYSDFWADPSKQKAPKAWENMSLSEKETAVYEYTYNSLMELYEAGVDVRMVQVGNETNNGICGESTSNWSNVAAIYNAGSSAVRAYEEYAFGTATEDGSEVMVALHFTEPHKGVQATFAKNLADYGVDYDIFATSYYPFWHGTLENLNSVLSNIASTYGKKVMVAETSYAYTYEDGDGHENNVRASKASELTLNYNISMQGQANSLTDIMKTLDETTGAIGMFYWEPAWTPVQPYDADAVNASSVLASNQAKWERYGSGWAASYAAEYDPEDAGRYYGGSSWDNQALFDHNGNPLDSLNVFKYVETGATTDVKLDVVNASAVEFEQGEEIVLPAIVTGVNNDGTEAEVPVIWNESDIAAMNSYGTFVVNGVAEGLDAICNVELLPINLLVNGGFEDGIGDGNGWTINAAEDEAYMLKIVNDDIKRGNNALKFDAWSATITDATVTQTVTDLPAGVYACFMNVQGGAEAGSYTISISAKGDADAGADTAELAGWMSWDKVQVNDISLAKGGDITVTIGITTTAMETWGTIDEVYLYRVGDVPSEGGSDNDSKVEEPKEEPKNPEPVVEKKPTWNNMPEEVKEVIRHAVIGQVKAVAKGDKTPNVNVNFVSRGETKVQPSILGEIKGKNVAVAFHGGNGFALSISGKDLGDTNLARLGNLDLTVDTASQSIPASVMASKPGTEKKQIAVKDTGDFAVPVNIHVGVGAENEGKYAILYLYDKQYSRLEYVGSYQINEEGQSMFALKKGGDYLVTVTETMP